MARKTLTAFRLDPEILEALATVKEREGIPMAEQVRRALLAWLASKGVPAKAARRRGETRRRA